MQRIKECKEKIKEERSYHVVDWDFIIENPSLTADDKYSIYDFKVDPNIVCCHKRQLIRLHLQHFTLSFVCLVNYVCIDVLKAAVCFLLSYKKNKHIVCCSSTEPGLFPVNPLLSSIHDINCFTGRWKKWLCQKNLSVPRWTKIWWKSFPLIFTFRGEKVS